MPKPQLRQFGFDPMLEQHLRDKQAAVSMSAQYVTKIETVTKRHTTDSGNDEVAVKFFTEKDACLVTVKNWDTVVDKETCMRLQIIPSLSQFGLDPSTTVVLQFVDSKGELLRYVPSSSPKALPPRGD